MNRAAIRRWAPWLALVILFSIVTSLLSWWQFSRREERVEKINLVIANYDAPVVPYEDISWVDQDGDTAALEWRPVEVNGRYLPEHARLVRNRPLNGSPGFLQLVPFQLDNGQVLVVERGWLSAGSEITAPSSNPLPNDAARTLVVRLRAPEPNLGKPQVEGQLASLDIPEVARQLVDLPVETRYYGRLAAETPQSETLPLALPKPSLNEGNHLSYALQWILFGLMAFAAFIWAYRNDRRIAQEALGLREKAPKRRTQASDDADYEDQNH